MAQVLGAYRKPARRRPMVAASSLTLKAGHGVEDDVNADPRSPRQVLVATAADTRGLGLEPGDLRENVFLDGIEDSDLPSGASIKIGDTELRVTIPCEPCATLMEDTGLLPRVAEGHRGVLCVVVSGGTLRVGDHGAVRHGIYLPLPDRPKDRLAWLTQQIPRGNFATYGALARAAGLPMAAARAVPKILDAAPAELPRHRVIPRSLARVPAERLRMLIGEGVSPSLDLAEEWLWADTLYQPAIVLQGRRVEDESSAMPANW